MVFPPRFRVAAAVAALLAAPASATDGVLEINQTCAAVGCFDGDTAGYPVTVTTATPAKSFRLTSDLVVATASETAISVRSNGVRIDLGGFQIRGPATCTGTPAVCAGGGVGSGVAVDATAREGVEVRNGSVTGMGSFGVFVGLRGVIEDVRAIGNGSTGIQASTSGAVRDCTSSSNGNHGIVTSVGGLVSGSEAFGNGQIGIQMGGDGASVLDSVARQNGSSGINVNDHTIVARNVVTQNQGAGLSAALGVTITDNTISENHLDGVTCTDRCNVGGNAITGNGTTVDHDGLVCGVGCLVRGNGVALNRGVGLRLGTDSAYRANVVTGNATLAVSGGVNRGDNHCAGAGVVAATCP